ncbi:hypothetical protein LCGC14_1705940, partial [marine sediment metagenome]
VIRTGYTYLSPYSLEAIEPGTSWRMVMGYNKRKKTR